MLTTITSRLDLLKADWQGRHGLMERQFIPLVRKPGAFHGPAQHMANNDLDFLNVVGLVGWNLDSLILTLETGPN